MGIGSAISSFYSNYCVFGGRASRSAYWWPIIFVNIVTGILSWLSNGSDGNVNVFWAIVLGLFELVNILPNLGVSVRRLHDTGRGGGWIFINLLPFIGNIWFLILMLLPSQGPNRFGPESE